MKYKTVIWDFNGTLLSDMQKSIDAMNTVLSRRRLPLIPDLEAFRKVFGFPVEDYYARIGLDFSKEPYKVYADEWVELYSAGMFSCPLTKGATEALDALRAAGVRQLILSASERNRLIEHTKRLGIDGYFDEILGMDNVYARGKAEIAREYAKRDRDGIFPAVLIGDTDHDYLCAKDIGCDCILFCGGFMSKERLLKLGAPVYDSLTDIVSKILTE